MSEIHKSVTTPYLVDIDQRQAYIWTPFLSQALLQLIQIMRCWLKLYPVMWGSFLLARQGSVQRQMGPGGKDKGDSGWGYIAISTVACRTQDAGPAISAVAWGIQGTGFTGHAFALLKQAKASRQG